MSNFYDAINIANRVALGIGVPAEDQQDKPAIYQNVDEGAFLGRVIGHGFNNQELFAVQQSLLKADSGQEFEQYLTVAGFNDRQIETIVNCLTWAAIPTKERGK